MNELDLIDLIVTINQFNIPIIVNSVNRGEKSSYYLLILHVISI